MVHEQIQTGTTAVWVDKSERRMIVERVFDAPRELVWKAFTEADALAKWWGPREWNTTNSKLDLKVGGEWLYCMTGPDGTESWGKATYTEITPPERLVYEDAFSDASGGVNPDMPVMVISYEFTEQDGKTKVRSVAEFASAEQMQQVLEMGIVQGLTETWDRLGEYLAS